MKDKKVGQMREEFRTEIRRQNVESIFMQKRLVYKQSLPLPSVPIDALIKEIQNAPTEFRLHELAFKYTGEADGSMNNISYLIQRGYVEVATNSVYSSQQCYGPVFRTLANCCHDPAFFNLNTEMLKKTLIKAFEVILQKDIATSDCLVYVGNLAVKSEAISVEFINSGMLPCLLSLVDNQVQNLNLIRNMCYCIHSVTQKLQEKETLTQDIRYGALQIVCAATKIRDSDMIHQEILVPFISLYQSNKENDQLIINTNLVPFVIGSIFGEMQEYTIKALKMLSISDNEIINDMLFQGNILEICNKYLDVKKLKSDIYLILVNLSYNNANISLKIVSAPIMGKLLNRLIKGQSNELKKCLNVILNLFSTGDDQLYTKLINLGLINFGCHLLQTNEEDLLFQLVNMIQSLLNCARETQNEVLREQINAQFEAQQLRNLLENIQASERIEKVIDLIMHM